MLIADPYDFPQETRHKIELLNLAKKIGSVSLACKQFGVSRNTYYRYKKSYDENGIEAFKSQSIQRRSGKKFDPVIENTVLAYAYRFPEAGKTKASRDLAKAGIDINANDVNSIWIKHGLSNVISRKAVDKLQSENNIYKKQIDKIISKIDHGQKDEKIADELNNEYPGYLGVQGCYFFGVFQNVGIVYEQIFLDVFSEVAFVKLYVKKKQTSDAIDLLSDKVLPFFARENVKVRKIYTSKASMYLGEKKSHPFQTYLANSGIQFVRTLPKNHIAMNLCENFHQVVQNEFYAYNLDRTKINSLEFLQVELDSWLDRYNKLRIRSAEKFNGMTCMEMFKNGKGRLISAP
jgi:hypothetical protein